MLGLNGKSATTNSPIYAAHTTARATAKESVNNGPFHRRPTCFVDLDLSRCGMVQLVVVVAVLLAMLLALAAIQQTVAGACYCNVVVVMHIFCSMLLPPQ